MKNLKTKTGTKVLAIALFSLLVSPAFGAVAPTAAAIGGPLGFKDWKANRVSEARASLEKLQVELDPNLPTAQARAQVQAAKAPGRVQKTVRTDSRLAQAQTNFEIAQELGAHDYFVLYLSQLKSENDIQEAAKKLDPSEVAEIMIGIKKQLSSEATSAEPSNPIATPTPGIQRTSRNP
jgi:hypothetical protein